MANINEYFDEYDEDGDELLSPGAANRYAEAVATEALQEYIKQSGGSIPSGTHAINTGDSEMNNDGINEAANAVMTETKTNAGIISGEILLENIETVADKLILSRLNWWQKLTITTKNRELAVTLATYAIVHALKTGVFGLTKYRINHVALDYVTLAANARLLKYVIKATGVDTNVAESFLTMPTISTGA